MLEHYSRRVFIKNSFLLGAFLMLPKNNSDQRLLHKKVVAEGLELPTDFVFLPDGNLLVTEKRGAVRFIKNGAVLQTPAIELDVDDFGERGLLGISPDPEFLKTRNVYLFYTNKNPLEIRISCFNVNNTSLDSEVIIMRSFKPIGQQHVGGGLRFGRDGKLWISVGDNGEPENAQDLSNIHGKILRIDKGGDIPWDNPFFKEPDAQSEIWAYGLRNPFRFSFLPDGRPIVGDVGGHLFEEINIIDKGGNYGWPLAEGYCEDCSFKNPVYAYPHSGSAAVIGGFIDGNSYFFSDLMKGYIKRLVFDSEHSVVREDIVDPNAQTAVSIQQQDNRLYYLNFLQGKLYASLLP